MAATASILMRAFRVADGSFFMWRAGAYDPTMSDATGDQAPPFPTGDYSDQVQVGTLGGPLARSDADSFTVPGLGTSGAPVTFPGAGGIFNSPPTECRDFTSISCWVVITAAPTTPAVVSLISAWSNKLTVAASADIGVQRSDDAIVDGVSPQNEYIAEYEIGGITAASGAALGPFNVPVRGRGHILIVKSDTGDVEGYVLAMRMA
ncbi:hypothetical protein N9917_00890 [Deltaproteobacteria bacterium]|nr:hypothetical protein [Deltaproteobacteria bacterium]